MVCCHNDLPIPAIVPVAPHRQENIGIRSRNYFHAGCLPTLTNIMQKSAALAPK